MVLIVAIAYLKLLELQGIKPEDGPFSALDPQSITVHGEVVVAPVPDKDGLIEVQIAKEFGSVVRLPVKELQFLVGGE